MSPASQRLAILPDDTDGSSARDSVSNEDSVEAEGFLSAIEVTQLRQEKLATIRQAVAEGVYDSQELLEKAIVRMMDRLEDSPKFNAQSQAPAVGLGASAEPAGRFSGPLD